MKKIFIGIDISKQWIDVCVKTDGQPITHQRFDNNRTGFKAMLKWIKQSRQQQEEWLICMEHTGIYGLPLWYFLAEEKITYCVVPGSLITSGLEIRRGKNDKISAMDIAKFAMRYSDELKPHQLPAELLQKLKMLFGYRERLVKAKVLIQVPANEAKQFSKRKQRSKGRQQFFSSEPGSTHKKSGKTDAAGDKQ